MKDIQQLTAKLTTSLSAVTKYLPILFVVLLLGIYGFLVFQVHTLTTADPADSAAQEGQISQVKGVNQKLINQLQSLQDNSTSVQTLFDQARDNPFQE